MTISTTTNRAQFSGSGTTGPFPFTFKVFAAGDLTVIKTVSGSDTTLTITTDYSVSLNADQNNDPGGEITLVSALAVGQTLTVLREVDTSQETDITNGGGFYPEVIENALDKLTMLVQQTDEEVGRALTLPVTVIGASAQLPLPSANQVIGWNSTGDALVNLDAANLATQIVGTSTIIDVFSGNGSQTAFVLSADPLTENNTSVYVGGVYRQKSEYSISGTTLTFSVAPVLGTGNIEVVQQVAQTYPMSSLTDNVVTTPKIVDGAVTTAKIADDAVTNAKLANMATARIKGRATAGSGDPEDITLSQVLDMVGSAARGDILFRGASDWSRLAAGTSGHYLKTNGAGADPTWAAQTVQGITLATPVASTSGTSIDFTGIPAGTKRITVTLNGVSVSASGLPMIQIGDSGGIENTGYTGRVNGTNFSAGFTLVTSSGGAYVHHATAVLNLVNSSTNTWAVGSCGVNDGGAAYTAAGYKALSATLDRVRITTSTGTDTFDAGEINISYE